MAIPTTSESVKAAMAETTETKEKPADKVADKKDGPTISVEVEIEDIPIDTKAGETSISLLSELLGRV